MKRVAAEQSSNATGVDSFISIPETNNNNNPQLATSVRSTNHQQHLVRKRSSSTNHQPQKQPASALTSFSMNFNSNVPSGTASPTVVISNTNSKQQTNEGNNTSTMTAPPSAFIPPPPPSHPQLNMNQRFTRDQTVHLGVIETILGDLAELSTDINDANIYDMRKNSLSGWSGSLNRSLVTLSSAIKGALDSGERAMKEVEILLKEKETLQNGSMGTFGAHEKSAIMDPSDIEGEDELLDVDESEIKQITSTTKDQQQQQVGHHGSSKFRLGSKIHQNKSSSGGASGGKISSRTNSFYQRQQQEAANALLMFNNNNNTYLGDKNNNNTKSATPTTAVNSSNNISRSNSTSRETPANNNTNNNNIPPPTNPTTNNNTIYSGRRSNNTTSSNPNNATFRSVKSGHGLSPRNGNNTNNVNASSPLGSPLSIGSGNNNNNNNNSSAVPRQSFSLTSYVSGSIYFIMDALLATLDCSWCSCFLLQARSSELVLVASVGTRRDQKPGSLRLSSTSGIESLVLTTGIGMNISHAYSEDEFNPLQDQVSTSRKAPTNDGTLLVNTGEKKSTTRVERTKSELIFPLIRPGLDGSNWGSHAIGVIQCCNKKRSKTVSLGLEELSFQDTINNNQKSSSHGLNSTSSNFAITNFTAEDEHRVAESCHILCTILARHPCDISSPLCHDAAQYLNKSSSSIMKEQQQQGGLTPDSLSLLSSGATNNNNTVQNQNNNNNSNFTALGGRGIFIPNPKFNINSSTSPVVANETSAKQGRRTPKETIMSSNNNTFSSFSSGAAGNTNNGAHVFSSTTSGGNSALTIQPGSRHSQLVYRTSKAGHVKRTELLQGAVSLPAIATISDAMNHVAVVTSGWKNAVMLNVELEHEVSKFKDQVRSLQRDKARLEASLAEKFIGGGGGH